MSQRRVVSADAKEPFSEANLSIHHSKLSTLQLALSADNSRLYNPGPVAHPPASDGSKCHTEGRRNEADLYSNTSTVC